MQQSLGYVSLQTTSRSEAYIYGVCTSFYTSSLVMRSLPPLVHVRMALRKALSHTG
ncbi:hypothetical protein H6G41_34025 [Tolypothrix sp. FACHB-123]|uniref:hypothetical protein n=1 Tax=Tolypothrix sp. FACHB-123 TaxID=2692868 RepID=UPI001685D8D9|nr:hypothetical protein [Tolypothrix sp. FACHB-123]MBD2359505.1 hypothetical protein [Tolypothrix sp. FACHB-123]